MSWKQVKIRQFGPRSAVQGVWLVAAGKDKISARLDLGEDVLAEMGWVQGTRALPVIGTHVDVGLLALVEAGEHVGLKIRRRTSKGSTLCLECCMLAPTLGITHEGGPTLCKHSKGEIKLDDQPTKALVIVLPPWARGNGKDGGR